LDSRITSLRVDLLALLEGSESRQHLESVVAVCHSLALSHLRSKGGAWKMMDFHGLNQGDLAYDCIGDLFRRDEQGHLAELRDYFAQLELDTADSSEILVHLRRLVFAKTNKNLSRLIAETDSFFFRTMRNIRNAVASTGKFVEMDRFGEIMISPQGSDQLLHLPMLVEEELAQLVWGTYSLSMNVPMFIGHLHNAVCAQQNHCRLVPLLPLVSLLKEASEKRPVADERDDQPQALSYDDVREIVTAARKQTDRKFHRAYVDKGKVTETEFLAYLNTIENILIARVMSDYGHDLSLCSSLQQELQGLTESQYRESHRARIEYMARYMHQRIAERLK
jgi:hypothetical protein